LLKPTGTNIKHFSVLLQLLHNLSRVSSMPNSYVHDTNSYITCACGIMWPFGRVDLWHQSWRCSMYQWCTDWWSENGIMLYHWQ